MGHTGNSFDANAGSLIMYIDMNSYFASCEQQDDERLRGRPIGVVTHDSPYACVIAPSGEAKKYGVKTGMRFSDCKVLCPHIIPVKSKPHRYRDYHIRIMKVLHKWCDAINVRAKSIDEAVINLTTYKLVYPDTEALARNIKEDIRLACGDFVKCSIGIAPNSFLAKLATELQKPDGLIRITPDNVDSYLKTLKLTDLPGIAKASERRLNMIGIKNPLDMRHSSDALLRKAFGGIVGNYWHSRLNFKEVDMYTSEYRAMSATRTISPRQRNQQSLNAMLISLCTRLEQRLVKQSIFCKEVSFFIRYSDHTGWDTHIRLAEPLQDAMDLRRYIMQRIEGFEQAHKIDTMFSTKTLQMGVNIAGFIKAEHVQYTLFENSMRRDVLRVAMYDIKDKYGRDKVRKASETVEPKVMVDAIGFGSVKDLQYNTEHFNQFLLEE